MSLDIEVSMNHEISIDILNHNSEYCVQFIMIGLNFYVFVITLCKMDTFTKAPFLTSYIVHCIHFMCKVIQLTEDGIIF